MKSLGMHGHLFVIVIGYKYISLVGNEKQQNSSVWQACDRRWNSCLRCLTGPVCGRVWIVFLCVNPTIFHDVVECLIHPSTVATLIVTVTVQQLLLRQCNQLACPNSVDTFNRSSCWECPATPCRNYNRPSSSFASSQNLGFTSSASPSWIRSKSSSSGYHQYVTQQKYFSHPSLVISFFPTPPVHSH